MTRALHELEIYQPWAATFDDEQVKHAREVINILKEAVFQVNYLEHMDIILKGITELAMPGDGKFRYPTDKKRTKQTVHQMIIAEKNLDFFWNKFDAKWKKLSGKDINACMGDHPPKSRGRIIERTKPWIEPIKAVTKSSPSQDAKPWIQDDSSQTISQKIEVKKTKQKVKTKGSSQPQPPEASLSPTEPPSTDQPKFKVPQPLLKVFRTLFFQPGQATTPGEIPWIDFLRAMVAMGFTVQKLYGSVWQFTPVDTNGADMNIQFHEPHPGVKIGFTVVKRMGRRLTRAFGWSGEMFESE